MPSTSAALVNVRPRLRIDGQARANLGEGALALQIHLPRSGMASAELRLLNWGPSAAGQPDFLFQDLRLGSRIDILLGEDAAGPDFSGEITALEERYGDGAPQLVVLAEDALHRLARLRDNRAFEAMSLDDVVRRVANDADLQADVQASAASATWLQNNESHLAFLLRLLGPHDIGLRIDGGRLRARDEAPDPSPLRLDPGENAERIRIVADLNQQPSEVAVSGYNLQDDADASGSTRQLSPAPAGRTGAAALGELGWAGASIPPHPFARSQAEAETLARKQFRRRAQRFLYGEITCRGTPGLRAGREVELAGVSARLAGRYRVDDCQHRFDLEHGLTTRIRVERADWNP